MNNEIKTWQDRVRDKVHSSFRDTLTDDELSIIGTKEMLAEIAELRARIESLAADAERYRWLRDTHLGDDPESINLNHAKKRVLAHHWRLRERRDVHPARS